VSIEIRPATADEMPEFGRVVGTALARPASDFRDLRPEWTLCAFEDDRLATAYAAWPLQMRLDGVAVPIAGVTTVSTNPVYRRRGYLRQITEQHFRQLYETQQQPIAALYASLAAIYQRYGYGIISTHHRYAIEPRYIQFSHAQAVPGSLRETTKAAEFPLLVDLYRRFREDRTGYVHRGAAMWAAGVLSEPHGIDTTSIIVYEEAGQPLGYAIATTGPGPDGSEGGPEPRQRLEINDLIWLTPAAYRAMWEHLGRFDLVGRIVWGQVPADDPLPHLLLEPRMLRDTSSDGVLARIVDLERALTARRYPLAASLRFDLLDDLCPWNTGLWELEASPEGSAVRRLPAGSPVDLILTPSTLAMLLFNQISAAEAARMGRTEVQDAAALPRWDAALHTRYRPFSADHW
jgi:predicted acetyltransferase